VSSTLVSSRYVCDCGAVLETSFAHAFAHSRLQVLLALRHTVQFCCESRGRLHPAISCTARCTLRSNSVACFSARLASSS
jgi:hypothetical protein